VFVFLFSIDGGGILQPKNQGMILGKKDAHTSPNIKIAEKM